MKSLKKSHAVLASIFGLTLVAVPGVNAQVSTINSVVVQTNVVTTTNLPSAVLTVVSNYPSVVSFTETNAGINTTNTTFSAYQDVWQFSTNKSTPYLFQTNDYYTAYMNVTLTGNPISPRKEAGFAFNDVAGNISGQYILDTDNHEVVAFGGNLPFYASPLDGTFTSGETITMGVTIFKDANGSNAIIYSANGISSPVLEFGGPGQANAVYAINSGTTPAPYWLGGYFQIQGQSINTNTITPTTNNGSAVFQNITIVTQPNLNIAENGNQSVLYWNASSANFRLQTSTNLASTNWTTVPTNGAYVIGVAVTNNNPASFYRLITP
jgi:hypothetical protein